MTVKVIFLIFTIKYKQLKKRYVLQDGVLHLIFFLKDHKVLRPDNQD